MTVEEEEIKNKEAPLQDEEEEEDEEGPGLAPGVGKFLRSDTACSPLLTGFRE